jgi:hypothetical protein
VRTLTRLVLIFALLGVCDLWAADPETPYVPHVLGPSLLAQAADRMRAQDNAGAAMLLERWLEADPRDGRILSGPLLHLETGYRSKVFHVVCHQRCRLRKRMARNEQIHIANGRALSL